MMNNKKVFKKVLKQPPNSQDWNEGEDIEIKGVDRQLRIKMDNYQDGPRWHPSENKYIKMKLREGAKEYE